MRNSSFPALERMAAYAEPWDWPVRATANANQAVLISLQNERFSLKRNVYSIYSAKNGGVNNLSYERTRKHTSTNE